MWRKASVLILVLYLLCSAFLLLVAWGLTAGSIEHQPPAGVWIGFLAFILGIGFGMFCIYVSVGVLRQWDVLRAHPRATGAAPRLKFVSAVVTLAAGWLTVFFWLGLRASDVVALFTYPWPFDRLLQWGTVALLLGWMVVGFLDRPRVANSSRA